MENKLKVYHVAGWTEYSNWFPNSIQTENIEEADIVLFEGGSDVTPSFYGENKHPYTSTDISRDYREAQIFQVARQLNKKIVGVCRGSQFLCCMAGGKLVQHQNNPGTHLMITSEGKVLMVSSTHHQAQYPFNLPENQYKILGWTDNMLQFHEGGNKEEMNPPVECEVVYYPEIDALGIQPHPEFLYDEYHDKPYEGYEETIEWFRETLDKFLNNKL